MKKIDIIIAVIAVAVAGILYFSGIISPKEKGVYAVVYVGGNEYGRLPLDKDGSIDVVTEYGENKVIVKDGYADCIYADCRDGLCVEQKEINKVNESIICLPHKLVVEIEGGKKAVIDSVSE